ncbi:alkaline phosphatase [Tundrisphaera sp. TA3]|uniref:alkaline phosphatase n=1 Tax=Tundrisphaera sp. TA3 TaxID=3435775 RepID=UPI003EBEF0BA
MIHRPDQNSSLRPARRPIPMLTLAGLLLAGAAAEAQDRLKQIQSEAIATKDQKRARPYHFGSQGPGDVFSNHTSHSNRLIPFYTFGRKIDVGSITGANSTYRDEAKIKALYGELPQRTLNPSAEYADQSDIYRLQKDAVAKGVKHLFIAWFDGMDYDTTRAAALAKSGKDYAEGKGAGLVFQDYPADGTAQYGYYVTSPTHDKNIVDLDKQTVKIPITSLLGGYDAEIAGPNPWTLGPKFARGYFKGQGANAEDKSGVAAVGGVLHAYTDSSQSAAEIASGVKSYNNGVNVTDDGRFVPTLFAQLQGDGWKVGTVTSVPFDHVSPAAMYAHNVHRDDYQDLARDMLGLKSIAQETGKFPQQPGLDVVMGAGSGIGDKTKQLTKEQGSNAVSGNTHITDADKAAIDVANGGKYVVVETQPKVNGAAAVAEAAERAAKGGHRLFGFFGKGTFNHLPYRTADGNYDPTPSIKNKAEKYTADDLNESPKLVDLTNAALKVLSAEKGKPFALFVEAGDVDFGLHDNNLDNAVGAVLSGEAAVRAIIDWVEKNSNWDESALIVSADHGHYLVIDDPAALAGTAK